MTKRTLPGLGLEAFFDLGENGWNDEFDENFRLLSFLVDGRAISRVTSLPGTGTTGDVYIVPSGDANGNDVAIWDGASGAEAWVYYTAKEGWAFYVLDEDLNYQFDGSTWQEFAAAGNGGGTSESTKLAVIQSSSDQVIPATTTTVLTFGASDDARDIGEFWDSGSPSQFTIPANVDTVMVTVTFRADTDPGAAEYEIYLRKNSTAVRYMRTGNTAWGGQVLTAVIDVSENDVIDASVWSSLGFTTRAESTSISIVDLTNFTGIGASTTGYQHVTGVLTSDDAAVDYSSAFAAIAWDGTTTTSETGWSGANASRVPVPSGATLVRVTGSLRATDVSAGANLLGRITKNGTGYVDEELPGAQNDGTTSGSTGGVLSFVSAPIEVTDTDYFEMEFFSSDNSITIHHEGTYLTVEVLETTAGVGGGASALNELSDVAITSAALGHILLHDGTSFKNLMRHALLTPDLDLSAGDQTISAVNFNENAIFVVASGAVLDNDVIVSASSSIPKEFVVINDSAVQVQVTKGTTNIALAANSAGIFITKGGANDLVSISGSGGGASALGDLTNVTLTTPVDGQRLVRRSGTWINEDNTVLDMEDVSGSIADGEALVKQGTSVIGVPFLTASRPTQFGGALLVLTANNTASDGVVAWDEATYDTDSIWPGAGVDESKMVVPVGVTKVRIHSNLRYTDDNDLGFCRLLKNGSSEWHGATLIGLTAGNENVFGAEMSTPPITVEAGDFFQVENSGLTTLNLIASRSLFAMEIVERVGGQYSGSTDLNTDTDKTQVTDDANSLQKFSTGAVDRTYSLISAPEVGDGFRVTVEKTDNGVGKVIVDPDGTETVDGFTTFELHFAGDTVGLISNGTNWDVEHAQCRPIPTKITTAGAGNHTPVPGRRRVEAAGSAGAGGGGGAEATAGSEGAIAGGGGGGAYGETTIIIGDDIAIGAVIPYVLGDGGAGGAAGLNVGSPGTDTTVGTAGAFLDLGAGLGGDSGDATSGNGASNVGAPGTVTTADFGVDGVAGIQPRHTGTFPYVAVNNGYNTKYGGSLTSGGSNIDGLDGASPAAGGTGGRSSNNSPARPGGDGFRGEIQFVEYVR